VRAPAPVAMASSVPLVRLEGRHRPLPRHLQLGGAPAGGAAAVAGWHGWLWLASPLAVLGAHRQLPAAAPLLRPQLAPVPVAPPAPRPVPAGRQHPVWRRVFTTTAAPNDS
jgi:hypothetical protein